MKYATVIAIFALFAGRFELLAMAPSVQLVEDADLHDVCFIGTQNGWVVGDRGLILATRDGGQTWHQQRSNVACRIGAVHFADRTHGIAVGGFWKPLVAGTEGIVLRTTNGGQTWSRERGLLLPALYDVQLQDRRHGWAIGSWSPLFPAGVFHTDDGGRSWKPAKADQPGTWIASDFAGHRSVLVGAEGELGAVNRANQITRRRVAFEFSHSDAREKTGHLSQSRSLAAKLTATGTIVCGQNGTLQLVADGFETMTTPELPKALRSVDFRAASVIGDRCWIAGAPGTVVVRSDDRGRTWKAFATNQPLPIHQLHFVDEQHGWAVSALGRILATSDGGETWWLSRVGGERLTLWGLFGRNASVPIDLLATASTHGYRSRVTTVGSNRSPLAEADRLHDAIVTLGGCGAETLGINALPDPEVGLPISAILDRMPGRPLGALENLTEQTVRRIRMWRPAVVIAGSATVADGLDELLAQILRDAVRMAADPAAFPQHFDVGLSPWTVIRGFRVQSSAPAPTAANFAHAARQLISRESIADSSTLIPFSGTPTKGTQNANDVFRGLTHKAIDGSRRPRGFSPVQLRQIRQLASKKRNIEAILARTPSDALVSTPWAQQIAQLTHEMDSETASQTLFDLGSRMWRSGQLRQANEMFQVMFQRYPESSLGDAANRLRVEYATSAEIRWREKATSFAKTVSADLTPREIAQGVRTAAYDAADSEVDALVARPTNAETTSGEMASAEMENTAEFADSLKRTAPALFAEPDVQLALVSAYRAAGDNRSAQSLLRGLASSTGDPLWKFKARRELNHLRPAQSKQRPWTCRRTARVPKLDGLLNEPMWQQAEKCTLQPHRSDRLTSVQAAYDEQNLYVAATCPKDIGVDYRKPTGVRTRDADLSSHDRIQLQFDINRDYLSFWQFVVDHRGWTTDSLGDDQSWNPERYVAAQDDDGAWTIEIAIPWDAISERPNPGTLWAVGVQRVTPGVGFQSWVRAPSPRPNPRYFGEFAFE